MMSFEPEREGSPNLDATTDEPRLKKEMQMMIFKLNQDYRMAWRRDDELDY